MNQAESVSSMPGRESLISLDDKSIEGFKEASPLPYILSNQSKSHENHTKGPLYPVMSLITRDSSSLIDESEDVLLKYSIHKYSSYSMYYHPQNVCENKPKNQLSRWSSGTQSGRQYITIKFEVPVIARSITFGKFFKSHVCNLKEFKILGGLDPEEEMIELLYNGLKNDNDPETFPLKHRYKNMVFPVQYITVIPLASYGTSFNYSIWYLEVNGISDQSTVYTISKKYNTFRDMEMMRLCLKYFRQKNIMDVFHLLKNRVDVDLEHPIVTRLHYQLVLNGDFDAVEETLQTFLETNVYELYSEKSSYIVDWKQIEPDNKDGMIPSGRGGHQMCIDVERKLLYVFGGYDGECDLNDLWCFDITKNSWRFLTPDSENESNPGPRSCHKMCFDPQTNALYVLGRYVDVTDDRSLLQGSDFFKYDLENNFWVKLSDDTASDGGPELVFDHQMCIDSQNGVIYVCGGKIIRKDSSSLAYSTLFNYNIKLNQWTAYRADSESKFDDTVLERAGHSMFIDESKNCLYLFSGQRGHECFYDLLKYDISQNTVTDMDHGNKEEFSREAGFAHRITFDEKLQEMYVFASYTRSTRWERMKNAFYVYSVENNSWQMLYENEILGCMPSNVYPLPRYAHQMVYDPETQTHYVFGGNPGNNQSQSLRLNDLWQLNLKKPMPSKIHCQCLFNVRLQRLKELCEEACKENLLAIKQHVMKKAANAIEYLRTHVTPLVDFENESQVYEFQKICTEVCLLENATCERYSEANLYSERIQLFEKLLVYIPDDMKEPTGKLISSTMKAV